MSASPCPRDSTPRAPDGRAAAPDRGVQPTVAMPTYEFRCRECGESFERTMHVDEFERVRDRGLECPKCKSTRVAPEVATFEVQTSSKTL